MICSYFFGAKVLEVVYAKMFFSLCFVLLYTNQLKPLIKAFEICLHSLSTMIPCDHQFFLMNILNTFISNDNFFLETRN